MTESSFGIQLEFPVELDGVISFSWNIENLKVVLEYVMSMLKRHEEGLAAFQDTKLNSGEIYSDLNKLERTL